ncbi:MAG: hypothetical protein C7B45_06975 [Sulfobacillus acidophilus]|uniref:Uncharacterized protein n=1 Tax=Sulfobacillus acidophilus TaxID=53633 RepID=A0A2T2WJE4_9FIRM|nr:MAG: hypothetical protein C7B45_06975 [Sulfobacillus acidophilus]
MLGRAVGDWLFTPSGTREDSEDAAHGEAKEDERYDYAKHRLDDRNAWTLGEFDDAAWLTFMGHKIIS